MSTDDEESTLSHLPPEVQHQILSYTDVASLFRLLLTCHHYKQTISNDCQHLWKAHLDDRWEHGKLLPKRFRDEKLAWSKANGWSLHRFEGPQLQDVEVEGRWFDEYLYRTRLDTKAEGWMANIKAENCTKMNLHKIFRHGEDMLDIVVKDVFNRRHIVDLTRVLSYQEWRFLHDSGVDCEIEDGAVALAKFFSNNDLDEEVCFYLDRLAIWLRKRMLQRYGLPNPSENETPYKIRDILIQMSYLFGASASNAEDAVENPFRGNEDDYYNPSNSLIHVVLEERKGIPISLAVVYIAIIRRAFEFELDVVGLPGHIVVGVPEKLCAERIFVDPFHSGRILSYNDCQEIVTRYNITFHERMADPISQVDVWQRMLRNLLHAITAPVMEDFTDNQWQTIFPLSRFLLDEMQRISSFEELLDNGQWRLHSLDPGNQT